jgi:exosome complex exonuclease RRP6
MLKYAREDTHYLLYIYDCLRKELIEKGLKSNSQNPHAFLKSVLHKSSALCLKTYEKSVVKDYNYYMIVARNKTTQTAKQSSVLKVLLKWRDYIARVEDESAF